MTPLTRPIACFAAIAGLVTGLGACSGTEFEPPLPIVQIVVTVGDCGGLRVGATCTLQATALDSSGTVVADPVLTWASTTNVFATVDFMGVVTGRNQGQETIIVATADGIVQAQTTVNVEAALPPPPEPDGL